MTPSEPLHPNIPAVRTSKPSKRETAAWRRMGLLLGFLEGSAAYCQPRATANADNADFSNPGPPGPVRSPGGRPARTAAQDRGTGEPAGSPRLLLLFLRALVLLHPPA